MYGLVGLIVFLHGRQIWLCINEVGEVIYELLAFGNDQLNVFLQGCFALRFAQVDLLGMNKVFEMVAANSAGIGIGNKIFA